MDHLSGSEILETINVKFPESEFYVHLDFFILVLSLKNIHNDLFSLTM